MHPRFSALVETLDPSFRRLIAMTPVTYATLPKDVPLSGIYMFSEAGQHLYVGRSRTIRKRLGGHCRPSATYLKGAFAFRLAREATGRKASYRKEGSRKALMLDPEFRFAFDVAKERIRKMEVRFVEESDPLRQTLLEVYVAVVLQTLYNDFDTH